MVDTGPLRSPGKDEALRASPQGYTEDTDSTSRSYLVGKEKEKLNTQLVKKVSGVLSHQEVSSDLQKEGGEQPSRVGSEGKQKQSASSSALT